MLTSLAVLTLFVFDGGNMTDFCQQYSATTNSNIVVAAYTPMPPMEFFYDANHGRSQAALNAKYIGYRIGADVSMVPLSKENTHLVGQVLRPQMLPMWFAPSNQANRLERYQRAFPASGVCLRRSSETKFLELTSSCYVSMEVLQKFKFDKPVRVHWFLSQYNIAGNGYYETDKIFLECVAFAIGGKLIDKDSSYLIDFDPKVFRTQYAAYLLERRNTQISPFDLAYTDFNIAAIKALSDEQIRTAMATEKSHITVDVAQGTPIGFAARKVIEAFLYDGMDPQSKQVNEGHQKILALGDLSKIQVLFTRRGLKLEILAAAGDGGAIGL